MKTRYIFLSAVVLILASCAKEGMEQVDVPGDAIRLSSYRQQVFTRADADEFEFAKDTKYTLLAVNAASNPTNVDPSEYDWASQKGFNTQPQTGTESEDHAIEYAPVAIFSVGKHLDFYGLTYGSTEEVPSLDADATDGVTPTITLSAPQATDRLPDLMHSNSVKNRTYTDGIITMPFEHALAAVNFYISKQDESGDDDDQKQLRNVKVTEIRLDNIATEATMDIVDGKWTWASAAQGSRVVYSNAAGSTIPTIAAPIGDTDVLVFPNDDYVANNAYVETTPYKYYTPDGDESANKCEQVIVTVKLEGLEEWVSANNWQPMNKHLACGVDVVDGAVEISFPLRNYHETTGEDAGPLHFLRNHKYILSVFVMRDNVRIVAISPQVYEWVSVDLNSAEYDHNVTTLGQPVTFGGTVWMDRNLGAKSADCENDWLHTLGYYWEYARNIPFILDVEVLAAKYEVPKRYKNDSGSGWTDNTEQYLCYKNDASINGANAGKRVKGAYYDPGADGTGTPVVAFPDYLFYTYDQNGNKVSKVEARSANKRNGYTDIHISAEALGKIVAVNPGDTGSYAFIAQSPEEAGGSGDQRIWQDYRYTDHIKTYWYDVNNQPVPKGWRLPNGKDVYSIMPEDNFYWFFNGRRFRQVGVGTHVENTSQSGPRTTTGTAKEYCGEYKYQYFYGSFEVNKSASGDYSAPIYNDNNITRVYGIKYQGTSKAYRYMIEVRESNFGGKSDPNTYNCGFVRFSMFPATASDRFLCDKSGKDAISTSDGTYNLVNENPKWNLHKFDWDHPSSYIDFPLQGQIEHHPMVVNIFGRDLKLRLMESYSATNNYCMKLSNAGTGFYGTWHSTTCSTRLVRDI